LGATSTPVNSSRNPFGSIQPKPGGLFSGSPQSESWRSPFSPSVNTNQNNSGAFGSFGAISSGGGGGGGSSGSSGFVFIYFFKLKMAQIYGDLGSIISLYPQLWVPIRLTVCVHFVFVVSTFAEGI